MGRWFIKAWKNRIDVKVAKKKNMVKISAFQTSKYTKTIKKTARRPIEVEIDPVVEIKQEILDLLNDIKVNIADETDAEELLVICKALAVIENKIDEFQRDTVEEQKLWLKLKEIAEEYLSYAIDPDKD